MESRGDARFRKCLPPAVDVLAFLLVLAVPCAKPFGQPTIALAAETSCQAAAVVSGADEMVVPVAALLRRRGVGSRATGCDGRVVRASLVHDSNSGLHVLHVDDGFGRTSDRTVADASTAASLIESWVLGEDAYLLSPRTPGTNPTAASPAAIAEAVPPATVATDSVPPSRFTWRLAAAAALSTDLKGNAQYGGSATGCARAGAVCLGGRARVARGTEALVVPGLTVPSSDLMRTTGEASAFVSLPLIWQRFSLAPALGLGAGWGRASVRSNLIPLSVPPRDDFSVHAMTAASMGLRLGMRWSILAELGVSLAKRVSGEPVNLLARQLAPPATFALRTSVGVEYAR